MARLTYASGLRRIMPPWLQRRVGGALMEAIGEQIDTLVDRTALSVKVRFPGHDPAAIDEDALALIGRDRKIRRGPAESAETYAARLRGWLDAHRLRGGDYGLLEQLYAYTRGWLDVRMDVVAQSGKRRWIDTAGTITADSIAWGGDGSDRWARIWVFFYLPNQIPLGTAYLVTSDGDYIVTSDGDRIVVNRTITPDELTDEEAEIFAVIPREWVAAHIQKTTVVLLWGARRLWNYPQPVPTWSEWAASGATWGESPVILQAE